MKFLLEGLLFFGGDRCSPSTRDLQSLLVPGDPALLERAGRFQPVLDAGAVGRKLRQGDPVHQGLEPAPAFGAEACGSGLGRQKEHHSEERAWGSGEEGRAESHRF